MNKKKSGRPKLEKGSHSVNISFSMAWSDYKLFMALKEVSGKTKSAFFREMFQEWASNHTPLVRCDVCEKILTRKERDNRENQDFPMCTGCVENRS